MGALRPKLKSIRTHFNSIDELATLGEDYHYTHFVKLLNKRMALFTAKFTSKPRFKKKQN